jgi:hypothetical protein
MIFAAAHFVRFWHKADMAITLSDDDFYCWGTRSKREGRRSGLRIC